MNAKLDQSVEIARELLKVSEPKTLEHFNKLWSDYAKLGSVQTRKNAKKYAKEKSK